MSSISIFKGFSGTIPTHSENNLDPQMVYQYVAANLQIRDDKKDVDYVTPIVFGSGPYSGKTAEWKRKQGLTEGVMRSALHAVDCVAKHVVFDFDETDDDTTAKIRIWAAESGVQFIAYSSYSYGKPGTYGNNFRLVVWLDTPIIGIQEYTTVWRGINVSHLHSAADPSSSKPYQMQGVWATHPDWKDVAWREKFITRGTPLDKNKYFKIGDCVLASSPFKKDGIVGDAELSIMNDEASVSADMMVPIRETAEQQEVYDALCLLHAGSTELLISVYGNLKALGDTYQGHFENWVYSSPDAVAKYQKKHPTKYDPRHMWTKNGWHASINREAAMGKIKQLARASAFVMLCNKPSDSTEAEVALAYLLKYHKRWVEKELAAGYSVAGLSENLS